MNTRSLQTLLHEVEPGRELWLVPGKSAITARDIRRLIRGNRDFLQRCSARKVAILTASDIELATLLVLLDGNVQQITLLPATVATDRLRRIVIKSNTDILLAADRTLPDIPDVETIPVQLETLWQAASQNDADALESPRPRATRWLLPTSGTTGEPKLVSHTLATLTRTVKRDLAKGKQYRWGSLYDLTGFAGLQVFLQSWCGGSCLIMGSNGGPLEQRLSNLVEGGCTALSATPTMWRKLLMSGIENQLQLKRITLGGEIVDQRILDALAAAFPGARIVHIYASTEAGVGFAVGDRRAGFPRDYLDHPPPGIRIRVETHGELLLKVERGDQQYVAESRSLQRDDGFIDTGDLVRPEGDRFMFLGRANGVINVGGNKVHPEEVERVLLDYTGVQSARASRRPSPLTGSLVQAEIVPDPSCSQDLESFRKSLIAHCRNRLEPFQVPAVVRFVETIESVASGKMKRD